MITTLSFDADNTLWDFVKVMRHSLECVRAELKKRTGLPDISIEEMISVRNEVANSLKGKTTNLEEIRLAAFKETLSRHGILDTALATELNAIYIKHRFEDIDLYEDVLPTLEGLKETYQLGIISNGNSYPERCGLDNIFDFTVFAQEHKVEKPDPRIFEITLSEAKCQNTEMIHVGDSLESDVRGGQSSRIQSVWLNRKGKKNNSDITPDYEIESLVEIPDILNELNRAPK